MSKSTRSLLLRTHPRAGGTLLFSRRLSAKDFRSTKGPLVKKGGPGSKEDSTGGILNKTPGELGAFVFPWGFGAPCRRPSIKEKSKMQKISHRVPLQTGEVEAWRDAFGRLTQTPTPGSPMGGKNTRDGNQLRRTKRTQLRTRF